MPFLTTNVNERYIGEAGSLPAELGGPGDPEFSSIWEWDQATKTGGVYGAVPPDTTEVGVIVGPTTDANPRTIAADGDARSATQRRALTVHSSIAHNGLLSGTPHFQKHTTSAVFQIGEVNNDEDYFILEGMHIRNDKRDNGRGVSVWPSNTGVQIHRCILDAGVYPLEVDTSASFVISQSLLYCENTSWSTIGFIASNDLIRVLANTLVSGQYVNNDLHSSGLLENCVLFGQSGTDPTRNPLHSTSSHNASDHANITDGATYLNASDWIAIDASAFVDELNGNYTPASGSKLLAAGQDVKSTISGYADAGYAPPVDVDLAYNPRPANGVDWDCGALQGMAVVPEGGTDAGVLLAFIL